VAKTTTKSLGVARLPPFGLGVSSATPNGQTLTFIFFFFFFFFKLFGPLSHPPKGHWGGFGRPPHGPWGCLVTPKGQTLNIFIRFFFFFFFCVALGHPKGHGVVRLGGLPNLPLGQIGVAESHPILLGVISATPVLLIGGG
jgi:hypothetical protein